MFMLHPKAVNYVFICSPPALPSPLFKLRLVEEDTAQFMGRNSARLRLSEAEYLTDHFVVLPN